MSSTSTLAYIILGLAIGYLFVYPSWNEIAVLQTEKAGFEESLRVISDIENKKNELAAQYNKISEADRKNIDTVLPDSLNFVKLISEIDTVAGKQGISIDNIGSRETDPAVGASIAEAQPQKPFSSAIISFSFTSSYDRFNTFMDSLEKSLRILDVKSVKITTLPGGQYNYTVDLETYWLKSK